MIPRGDSSSTKPAKADPMLLFFEASALPMAMFSADGYTCEMANASFRRLSRRDPRGLTVREIFVSNPDVFHHFDELLQAGPSAFSCALQWHELSADGVEIFHDWSLALSLIHDENQAAHISLIIQTLPRSQHFYLAPPPDAEPAQVQLELEEKLETSERRYEAAVRATRNAIWDWDLLSDDVFWNEALSSELLHPESSRVSDSQWWYDHLHPEDRDRVVSGIHDVIDSDSNFWTDQYRFRKGDGTYAIVRDRGWVSRNNDGVGIRMTGAMEDITLSEGFRRDLTNSEERFRALAEFTPQMLFIAEPNGEIVYFNQNFVDYTGLTVEEVGSWRWKEYPLHHPDDLQRTIDRWTHSVETGDFYEIEYRLRRRDGIYRWHLGRATALKDRDGQVIKWFGTNTDVHDQKVLVSRFEEAVEVSDLGFWDYSVREGYVTWTDKSRIHFGLPSGTLGLRFDAIVDRLHPEDVERVTASVNRSLEKPGVPYRECFRVVNERGELHWIECQGKASFNSEGQAIRFSGTSKDITAAVQNQRDLEAARDAAEAASQAKSQFLANMSHEIRTPLNAILGFSELLRSGSVEPEEHEQYLDRVIRSGQALTRIIDDILDISKVESGRMLIEKTAFDLHKELEDLVEMFREAARIKGIYLVFTIASSVPRMIFGDAARLRQVLINIVGNAIKFTSVGGVALESRAEPESDGVSHVKIWVRDTGLGIEPAMRDRLFQPFMQADTSHTRRFGGTGLGLALSKRLATMMQGDVSIEESIPGQGTTVCMEFRARASSESRDQRSLHLATQVRALGEGREASLDGYQILVVEDSPDNQFLIKRILAKSGAKVTLAQNGIEALEQANSGRFDLILMDIQMPGMDGYEATRTLREQGYQLPIVALTAHAMVEDRERTRRAGCDEHLTKPIDKKELLQVVGRLAAAGR